MQLQNVGDKPVDLQLKAESLEAAPGVLHATLTGTRAFPGCLDVTVLYDSDEVRRMSLSGCPRRGGRVAHVQAGAEDHAPGRSHGIRYPVGEEIERGLADRRAGRTYRR